MLVGLFYLKLILIVGFQRDQVVSNFEGLTS